MVCQVGALRMWSIIPSAKFAIHLEYIKTINHNFVQLWPFISYNWLFLWDYAFYKWGFVSTYN